MCRRRRLLSAIGFCGTGAGVVLTGSVKLTGMTAGGLTGACAVGGSGGATTVLGAGFVVGVTVCIVV